MKSSILFLTLLCFCNLFALQTSDCNAFKVKYPAEKHVFKKIKADAEHEKLQTIIEHDHYTIGYFEKYRIPLWTYYTSTKSNMLKCLLDRKGDFHPDPKSPLIQANDSDYTLPFEKGHLVPCEPMTFDAKAMTQTFYFTNCAPQYRAVNSGKWRSLEKLVNNWTIDNEELMVFTGNIVSDISKKRGPHEVAIPDYNYKIVLDYKEPGIKAIAFLVPNKDKKLANLDVYIKTIDEIEKMSGFDFFADLPKETQEELESVSDPAQWDWKTGKYDALFKSLKKQANKSK